MLDNQIARTFISTHAPRTGSDDGRRRTSAAAKDFNPRSPHGERLRLVFRSRREWSISTHAPRTGSDTTNCIVEISTTHFNPRSPHGERQIPLFPAFVQRHFNPRSPHGERQGYVLIAIKNALFQPTLPARGATRAAPRPLGHPVISTHAPRTGSDDTPQGYMMALSDFNPRSPHGERRFTCNVGRIACDISIHAPRTGSDGQQAYEYEKTIFISIHAPRTGSDARLAALSDMLEISIHAPRTGSDDKHAVRTSGCAGDFNPRSPHGERRFSNTTSAIYSNFNPRSPHGERREPMACMILLKISIHAPRTGSDFHY